jgi:polar amino acid transport system permease protein
MLGLPYASLAWLFLKGSALTALLGAIAGAAGLALAVAVLVARVEGGRAVVQALRIYVSLFRGTPFLIQLLLAYYVVPRLFGLDDIPPIAAGLLALSLNSAAFASEVLRGAFLTISAGQRAAGLSLGMTRTQVWSSLLLSTTLVRALPPLTGEFCNVVKGSSLLSVISVAELTSVARDLNNATGQSLVVFGLTGLFYGAILMGAVITARTIERAVGRRFGHARA